MKWNVPIVLFLMILSGGAFSERSLASSTAQTNSSVETTVRGQQSKGQPSVFWIRYENNKAKLIEHPMSMSLSHSERKLVRMAFSTLLEGPSETELTSEIPKGTKLRSLKVKKNGIHLNLSREFVNGGGSASMIGRLVQTVYTATSVKPDAALWISVEGKPLTELGGEGIVVEQPISRSVVARDFPL